MTATDAELSKYLCEHYAYEMQMLRFTKLELQRPWTMSWNAMLESCALHCRILRDFHTSRDPKDRTASEYGVTNVLPPGTVDSELKVVNKQVAHLDKKRPFNVDVLKLTSTRLDVVVGWLEATHNDFIRQCRASAKVGWSESFAAVASITPTVVLTATNTVSGASVTVLPASQGATK